MPWCMNTDVGFCGGFGCSDPSCLELIFLIPVLIPCTELTQTQHIGEMKKLLFLDFSFFFSLRHTEI